VVLDADGERLPRAEVLAALLLLDTPRRLPRVRRPAGRGEARALPAAAAWIEPRFRVGEFEGSEVYACGQGALVLTADLHALTVGTATTAPSMP
jgi:hypothetical protein